MSNSEIFSTVSQPLFRALNSSHPQLEFLSLNVTMNTYFLDIRNFTWITFLLNISSPDQFKAYVTS